MKRWYTVPGLDDGDYAIDSRFLAVKIGFLTDDDMDAIFDRMVKLPSGYSSGIHGCLFEHDDYFARIIFDNEYANSQTALTSIATNSVFHPTVKFLPLQSISEDDLPDFEGKLRRFDELTLNHDRIMDLIPKVKGREHYIAEYFRKHEMRFVETGDEKHLRNIYYYEYIVICFCLAHVHIYRKHNAGLESNKPGTNNDKMEKIL